MKKKDLISVFELTFYKHDEDGDPFLNKYGDVQLFSSNYSSSAITEGMDENDLEEVDH